MSSETTKRQERIKNIDTEIESWKNLKFNSEKMSNELNERINTVKTDLENIESCLKNWLIKKGQLMQNTSELQKVKKTRNI